MRWSVVVAIFLACAAVLAWAFFENGGRGRRGSTTGTSAPPIPDLPGSKPAEKIQVCLWAKDLDARYTLEIDEALSIMSPGPLEVPQFHWKLQADLLLKYVAPLNGKRSIKLIFQRVRPFEDNVLALKLLEGARTTLGFDVEGRLVSMDPLPTKGLLINQFWAQRMFGITPPNSLVAPGEEWEGDPRRLWDLCSPGDASTPTREDSRFKLMEVQEAQGVRRAGIQHSWIRSLDRKERIRAVQGSNLDRASESRSMALDLLRGVPVKVDSFAEHIQSSSESVQGETETTRRKVTTSHVRLDFVEWLH